MSKNTRKIASSRLTEKTKRIQDTQERLLLQLESLEKLDRDSDTAIEELLGNINDCAKDIVKSVENHKINLCEQLKSINERKNSVLEERKKAAQEVIHQSDESLAAAFQLLESTEQDPSSLIKKYSTISQTLEDSLINSLILLDDTSYESLTTDTSQVSVKTEPVIKAFEEELHSFEGFLTAIKSKLDHIAEEMPVINKPVTYDLNVSLEVSKMTTPHSDEDDDDDNEDTTNSEEIVINIPELSLEIGTCVYVLVLSLPNLTTVSVQPFGEELVELSSALRDYISHLLSQEGTSHMFEDFLSKLQVGHYCCGQFSIDQCWYRGKILDIDREEKNVFIQYIDYGNQELLPFSCLLPLPLFLSSLPAQALNFKIFDLTIPSDISPQFLYCLYHWAKSVLIGSVVQVCVSANKEVKLFVMKETLLSSYSVSLLSGAGLKLPLFTRGVDESSINFGILISEMISGYFTSNSNMSNNNEGSCLDAKVGSDNASSIGTLVVNNEDLEELSCTKVDSGSEIVSCTRPFAIDDNESSSDSDSLEVVCSIDHKVLLPINQSTPYVIPQDNDVITNSLLPVSPIEQQPLISTEQDQHRLITEKNEQPLISTEQDEQPLISTKQDQHRLITKQNEQPLISTEKNEQPLISTEQDEQPLISTEQDQHRLITEQNEQPLISTEQDEQPLISTEQDEQPLISTEQDQHRLITEQNEQPLISTEQDEQPLISTEQDEQPLISTEQDQHRLITEQNEQPLISTEQDEQPLISTEQDEQPLISTEQDQHRLITEQNEQPLISTEQDQHRLITEQNEQPLISTEQDEQPLISTEQDQHRLITEQNEQPLIFTEQDEQPLIFTEQNEQPLISTEQDQHRLITEQNEQPLISTEQDQHRLITEQNKQPLISTEQDEQPLIFTEQNEQPLISTEQDQHRLITEQNEQPLISTEQNEQPLISTEQDEQPLISTEQNEQPLISTEQDQHRLITEQNEQPLISTEQDQHRLITEQNEQPLFSTKQDQHRLITEQNEQPLISTEQDQHRLITEQNEQPLISTEQDQHRLITEQNEQPLISTEQDQHRLITEQNEQPLFSTEQNEQPLISTEQDEQPLISNKQDQHRLITEQNEQPLISTGQNEQLLISTEQDEQTLISTGQNEQPLISTEQDQHRLITEQNEQPLISTEQNEQPLISTEQEELSLSLIQEEEHVSETDITLLQITIDENSSFDDDIEVDDVILSPPVSFNETSCSYFGIDTFDLHDESIDHNLSSPPPVSLIPDTVSSPPVSLILDTVSSPPPVSLIPDTVSSPPVSLILDTVSSPPPVSLILDTVSSPPPVSLIPDTVSSPPPVSLISDTVSSPPVSLIPGTVSGIDQSCPVLFHDFSIGSDILLIVANSVSPSQFYVYPKTAALYLQSLETSLLSHYSTSRQQLINIQVGAVCCVHYSKAVAYCRAIIQSISKGGYVQVFCLDYGLIYNVKEDELYILEEQFYTPLAQVVTCTLADVYPITNESLYKEENSVLKEEREDCHSAEKEKRSKESISIEEISEYEQFVEKDEKKTDNCLSGEKSEKESLIELNKHDFEKEKERVNEPSLSEGKWEKCSGDVTDEDCFIPLNKESKRREEDISWSIKASRHFNALVQDKLLVGVVKDKQVDTITGPVYSILLYDTNEEEDCLINKLLVDSGLASYSKDDKSQSSSANSSSDSLLNDWDPMTSDYLSQRNMYSVDDEDISSAVSGFRGSDRKVCRFYNTYEGCYRGNNCHYLHLKEGVTDKCIQDTFSSPSLISLPSVGSLVVVLVTAIQSVTRFMVHIMGPADSLVNSSTSHNKMFRSKFLILLEEMDRHYFEEGRTLKSFIPPNFGELSAVWCERDGHWYRAITKDQKENELHVFYVDIGNEEWVCQDKVRSILPQFVHLPAQAVECTLYGTQLNNEKEFERSREIFEGIVRDKLMVAKVMWKNDNGVLGLQLYHTKSEGMSINEQLIQQKLVKPTLSSPVPSEKKKQIVQKRVKVDFKPG